MKIRWKLLILLLISVLGPLIVVAVLHRISMYRLGKHLAADARESLSLSARKQLRHVVEDYGLILDYCRQNLELSLTIQAREIERRLASSLPDSPNLFFGEDYDRRIRLPKGMVQSDKHFRPGSDGKPSPIQVTYEEQVYVPAPGVDRKTIADDIARLSTMPKVYSELLRTNPKIIYWQYTALESGFHTCYPGHGGYPPDYDPRKRPWYIKAKKQDSLIWLPPMIEVSTRTITLALAMPVRGPDGKFAGVTAIDVPMSGISDKLKLPESWASGASSAVILPIPPENEHAGKLIILCRKGFIGMKRRWWEPPIIEFLEFDDDEAMKTLKTNAIAGKSGVMEMQYKGRRVLCAYGAGGEEKVFPIVIVPYDMIVAQADRSERHVMDRTVESLKITGVVLVLAIAVAIIVAIISSHSVTKPITMLAEAAQNLADGNYNTHVHIKTRDELGNLSKLVNDMGPKLHEREKMRRSLALAMEIQQHLLPQEQPKLDGFDIAGKSIYCDETGGDYYDFIDLEPGKLGITIGDVSGHGIGAALLMASARGLLRSHAKQHGTDLGGLFQELNIHLVRDTGDARFMTLFYGVLDAENCSLVNISAGHDPAMWFKRDEGKIEELANNGMALGVIEEASYASGEIAMLQSGDIIAIGTDGIWETHNESGEMFSRQRLRNVLSDNSEKSAESICNAIVEAVQNFRNTEPQEDDITLVVIKAV